MLLSRQPIERPFRNDLRRHVCPGRGPVKGSKISGSTCIKMPRRKSRAARLTLAASVASPCEKGRKETLDIAPERDTVKNDVRNGGVGWPRMVRFGKRPEPDGRHGPRPSIRW